MQHCFNRLLSLSRGALPAAASAFAMAASLAILLPATPANAAELGDIAVRSYLNQPLTADIELVMLTPEEAAEGVPVRMAGANIYQGANVRMHPALAGARMSVQRKDQRLFVHIVTLQPVDAEVVHLYLELGSGSRAVVRAATLWLTPEPPGAPRPPVVRPVPAPVAAPSAAQEPAARPPATPLRPAPLPPPVTIVRPAAPTPPPAETVAAAAPAAGPVTSEPALPGFAPSEAALIAARARAAAEREAQARRAAQAGQATAGVPGAMPPRSAPARAACTPGQPGGEAKQCMALDQKNIELNAKIRDLEGKVRALQTAMGAPLAGGTAPGAAPATPAAGVAPAPSAAPAGAGSPPGGTGAGAAAAGAAAAASAPPAASAPAASAPMNPAGAVIPPSNGANGKKERRSGLNATTQIVLGVMAALALLGGLTYLIRKKKLKLPSREKLMFWQRWKRNKQEAADAPAEPQEPVMDKDGE